MAFLKGLSDADDRDEVVVERGLELEIDHVVGLVSVDAAFGVAEQDAGAADAFEHGGRGLAGVGAFVEPVHGLSAGCDAGVFGRLDDIAERRHGRKDCDLAGGVVLDYG